MTLHVQTITMLVMIAGGLYIGFAQDTYRRLATVWEKHRFFVYFFEICFWIIQTIILFIALYRVNYGEVRLYIVLACFLGFSMYVVLFQKVYNIILDWLTIALKKTLYIIYKIISVPIIFIVRIIISIVITIWKICKKIARIIWKLCEIIIKKTVPKKFFIFFTKLSRFYSTMIHKLSLSIKKLYRWFGGYR